MDSVADRFVEALDRFPDRVFLRRASGVTTSYRAIAPRIAETVRRFAELGIRAGDRVVCYLDAMEPLLCFTVACAHAGVVPVPVSPSFTVEMVLRLAEEVGATGVLATDGNRAALVERGVRPLCYHDEGALPDGAHALALSPSMSFAAARALLAAAAAERTGDDLYVLQPTSGTTGRFKLATRTHRVFLRTARLFSYGTSPDDEPPQRVLLIAALTHGMGQYLVALGLWLAAEFDLTSAIDTAASLEEVRALDPTYLCMTPRVLRSFYAQYERLGGDGTQRLFGPGAQILMTGGAAPDNRGLRLAASQGIDVVEQYGSSETASIALTARGEWREGRVGRVIFDVTTRVADDGELLVRSPWQMLGYYRQPELTREGLTDDGFWKTGDFCAVDGDGTLRYLGRKRDVFNTPEGSNIHPTRIEELIEQLPWVAQVALIGDQRPYLSALIVLREPPPSDHPDGVLDAAAHEARYARARADLAAVNARLERIERVRRVALLGRPMGAELWKVVGHGKVGRNRVAIQAHFRALIERLYAPDPSALITVDDER